MSDALPNLVIINNKPMAYDSQGDLVDVSISSNEPKRDEKVHQKSNIFKKSDFVTKSKFTHNGILTKHNFTRKEPPQNSKFSLDITNDFPYYSYMPSLFNKGPEYIETAMVFDDVADPPIESLLNSTYVKLERPTVAFYTTTPAPTTIIPIIVTQPTTGNRRKPNKKTKTKKTPPTPVASDIHEHIMKNLEYYKTLLSVNCTSRGQGNESKNEESETVEITPRPMKLAVNDKDIQSAEKEKDKSKKKCDCKHHHHGHSHHKHSHEHQKPSASVLVHQPSSIQPVYVHSQKVPEYQTHIHHHQSSKGNKGGLGIADNAEDLFGSTGE